MAEDKTEEVPSGKIRLVTDSSGTIGGHSRIHLYFDNKRRARPDTIRVRPRIGGRENEILTRMKGTIGVIGLGYVGLSLTAAFANVGHKVIGVDVDREKVKSLQEGRELSLYEPGLAETLKRCENRIEFTDKHEEMMGKSEVVIITVNTPLDSYGEIDLSQIFSVVSQIGPFMRRDQLVISRSTVAPGTTRRMAVLLEEASSLIAGQDFFVAYCPERMMEGMALYELYTLPKIIGGINPESTKRAVSLFRTLGGRIITVSALEVAELCKISDNLYRAVNIALANELGFICNEIGIDGYEMIGAVNEGYDRTWLFYPGLGAGGPCLTKDSKLIQSFAHKLGIDVNLISASLETNKRATLRVASDIKDFLARRDIDRPVISLLGLAFKGSPETDDIRNSPSMMILQRLREDLKDINFILNLFDPMIDELLDHELANSLEDCINGANVIAFLNNHPNIRNISLVRILEMTGRPLLILDCWHNVVYDDAVDKADVEVIRIGGSDPWEF